MLHSVAAAVCKVVGGRRYTKAGSRFGSDAGVDVDGVNLFPYRGHAGLACGTAVQHMVSCCAPRRQTAICEIASALWQGRVDVSHRSEVVAMAG